MGYFGEIIFVMCVLGKISTVQAMNSTENTAELSDEPVEETPPEFTSPAVNITVGLGREAILECPLKNLGNYRVAWLRADDQTILTLHNRVVTHSSRFSINHDTNTNSWRLHIRSIKETDRGCYMCQVNYRVMKKQVTCIDLLEPPKILDNETSGDITVDEGGDVTLQCRGEGNPMPKIIWRREDARSLLNRRPKGSSVSTNYSHTGERLVLKRINRHQGGAIFCIASNDVPPAKSKRILIHVHFKPTVRVPLLSYGSVLGGDVTMECQVEANPAATTYWKYIADSEQDRVLTNGSKYTINETRTGYTTVLTAVIHNLSHSDLGEYKCYANSGVGMAESGVVKIHETDRVTLPATTRITPRTTTPSTTTTRVYTSTSAKAATQKNVRRRTTRMPLLVEVISNVEIGESVPEIKGRNTKSSSYQAADVISCSFVTMKPCKLSTLYTISLVLVLYCPVLF